MTAVLGGTTLTRHSALRSSLPPLASRTVEVNSPLEFTTGPYGRAILKAARPGSPLVWRFDSADQRGAVTWTGHDQGLA